MTVQNAGCFYLLVPLWLKTLLSQEIEVESLPRQQALTCTLTKVGGEKSLPPTAVALRSTDQACAAVTHCMLRHRLLRRRRRRGGGLLRLLRRRSPAPRVPPVPLCVPLHMGWRAGLHACAEHG